MHHPQSNNTMQRVLLIILTLLTTSTLAQTKKIYTDGLKAGVVLTKCYAKNNFGNYTSQLSWKPGYTVGFTGYRTINPTTFLEIGFQCTSKGFNENNTQPAPASGSTGNIFTTDQIIEAKVNTINLDIPVNLLITQPVAANSSLYLAAGPYLGIGLFGNIKQSHYINNSIIDSKQKIKWNLQKSTSGLRRIDYGLNIGFGARFGRAQIGIQYSHGLANISANTSEGFTIANRLIGFTATILM